MLTPLPPEGARLVREFLIGAGYTHEQFRRNPALREVPSRLTGNLPALMERTSGSSVLNALIRLYFLGVPVEAQSIAGQIPQIVVLLMLESGILSRDGSLLRANVMLTPCGEFFFAADPAARRESPGAADLVLWPNPTSRLLQNLTIRRPAGATLDLGSGTGMQGILAASFSRQVTTTDLNPRAEEFTAFNAALNGIEGVECLTGDTFEPVKGRKFDLILCNPPFFVTPTSGTMYCENSLELDQYCERVIREAPAFLNEGGYLQMVLEWVQMSGQPWQERLSGWLHDNGCDAWVLRGYARDAVSYAQERMGKRWQESPDPPAVKFEEWMEYYRARGVEEVHGGMLSMRRRSPALWIRSEENWIRIEDMPVDPTGPFGDCVLETFATQEALARSQSDEQLLRLKPRLAPDARLQNHFSVSAGQWVPESTTLARTKGVPSALSVEPQVAAFLARCDGTLTLSELSQDLASAIQLDPAAVEKECCAVVRKLADRRLILLVG
jgi:SAM-dependent methyltransferase